MPCNREEDKNHSRTRYIYCYGPPGPQGIPGRSPLPASNLVVNGDMETVVDEKPSTWILTNPTGISSISTAAGVYTGSFATNINGGSSISQEMPLTETGRNFQLYFAARTLSSPTSLTVTVSYITPTGDVVAKKVTIRGTDMTTTYKNYTLFTDIVAPETATAIKVEFDVVAPDGSSILIDDVSLIAI